MPAKKKQTSSKKTKGVMDVSKPGKSAPSASSRPIIVGHGPTVKDPMVSEDDKMPDTDAEEHKIEVKRTAPKVIKPLSSTEELAETKDAESGATDSQPEPESAPEESEVKAEATQEPTDEAPEEIPAEETPEEEPSEEMPETEEEPQEEETDEPPGSNTADDTKEKKDKGSSVVDAIAGEAAKNKDKKEDDRKNEEIKKRLESIEKLVDEKKYFVKTSTTTKKERKTRWALLILSFLLLAGAYLVFDAQLIKNDYWLPYHFFKEEQEDKSDTSQVVPQNAEEPQEEEKQSDEDGQMNEPGESSPLAVAERDTERKNELKNLQQRLETYFNDNGNYPAALTALSPAPSADETTGPRDDAYTYTPAPAGCDDTTNCTSYTLSATLENEDDPETGASGKYVLRSVNQ